jgi:hypothetical protein
MVGNWPALGRSGCPDVAALKVRNLSQATNLRREQIAFCRSKVLAEPEKYIVDEHRVFMLIGIAENLPQRGYIP